MRFRKLIHVCSCSENSLLLSDTRSGDSDDGWSDNSSSGEDDLRRESTATERFEHADSSSDPRALAGHPEEGEAGQSVADGGQTLD